MKKLEPLVKLLPKGKPKSVKETLQRVRLLLSSKNRWMKGEFNDNVFNPELATKCCLEGALMLVDGRYKIKAMCELDTAIDNSYSEICEFNDDKKTTHKKMLKVLDKAIEVQK